MSDIFSGNSIDSLFVIKNKKNRRVSSYDKTGGNQDWIEVEPFGKFNIADIDDCGIIRHIWCTTYGIFEDGKHLENHLRTTVLRVYWDNCEFPSIEVPLGDFFGMGHGLTKNFSSAAFSMSPEDGRSLISYFPMPFRKKARFEIENQSSAKLNFYYYIDYEKVESLPEDCGYFHSCFKREKNTNGWAEKSSDFLTKELANNPNYPKWYPNAWMKTNTDGKDNYVILETEGKGKYVGCNLNIDVFERQGNDWYGEGDDMIFIDGELIPSLHGTGTEDYFNMAFCPKQEFCTPYSGLTLYSGEKAGFPWGGKNSMYRLHINDPIHFEKSIKVTIEHGHANKLSNDYSSTAYWYQLEPHYVKGFPNNPDDRIPLKNNFDLTEVN